MPIADMETNKDLLKRIKEKKKTLDGFRSLTPSVVAKLREKLIIDLTYNSNAIEGNTLTEKETMAVLEEGITISGKPLKDHLEAINHKEAILWVEKLVKQKEKINISTILNIHRIILTKINDAEAGRFRHEAVFIRGSRYVPPNYRKVPEKICDLEKWIQAEDQKISVVEKAALLHFKLVNIHPFFDGNGRTARLLMNLFLMQKGYPLSVILRKERKRYFSTLEEASLKGNTMSFVNFIAENIERALDLYLFVVEKKEYIKLSELAKETQYSQEYLSLLARKRRLSAIKVNGVWYGTKEEIRRYIEETQNSNLKTQNQN